MENKLNQLVEVLLEIKNKKEMLDFLRGILTPKEMEEISTRLQIVRLLKKGKPQQFIAKKLGVGIATVTRGSREIKQGRFWRIS